VTLANHAAGQEANKFSGYNSVRAGELFAFKLTNNTGSQATVTQVQFQLSAVTGIAQGDLSSLLIYQDDNNDGAIGVGETTTVGGSGVVNVGVTTITFSTSFNIAASSTVNYILKGTAVYLAIGDTMTMKRLTANFGIRYDKQAASVLPSAMEAPSTGIIPSLTAPGINDATKYGMWQPRAGLTYALNQSRKTQLRATYALFTNQIPAYAAAPSVYRQRAYFQAFADATAGARKYILLVTNTSDVVIFNLEDKIREDLLNLNVPSSSK